MKQKNVRLDVMKTLEKDVHVYMDKFLIAPEEIWQPSDFLPNSESDSFLDEVREFREIAKELDYDFWVTLVGDMITEEALPTYESWLLDIDGIDQRSNNSWSTWIRRWTAEENRHGDLLNKCLYLSGRVDMRQVEITIQYLIAAGMDIRTGSDPYKTFVYAAFQELATHVSHKNVAKLARKKGCEHIGRMCKVIAGDEMRHFLAYREFVKLILAIDTNQMILAIYYMIKKGIVMPAMMLRETGGKIGDAFVKFSETAQRIGVYTAFDYVKILERLVKEWNIGNISDADLLDDGKKARDFLVTYGGRLQKITQRLKIPKKEHTFTWVRRNGSIGI